MKTALTILASIAIILWTADQSVGTETESVAQADSKEERAMKDAEIIHTQLFTFEMINGRLPTEQEGISALVTNPDPENLPRWKQLLEVVPKDPWGREYGFKIEKEARRGFIVFSLGADPENSDGIITTK